MWWYQLNSSILALANVVYGLQIGSGLGLGRASQLVRLVKLVDEIFTQITVRVRVTAN